MTEASRGLIVVTGATGYQGSAVTRHLLKDGWRVRALTRNPASPKGQALALLGAELVKGDMGDPSTLQPAFDGAYGVFSLQNPMIGGIESEVQQGRTVAEAAKAAGVSHVVYGSAGVGIKGTGIPSWDSKERIETYMAELGLPVTVLRPAALMEILVEKSFYPAMAAWYVMPTILGARRPIGWIAADDVGAVAAKAFAEPQRFIGQEVRLAVDARSMDEVHTIYREIAGKGPSRFPIPIWLFKRLAGPDLVIMWRWLRDSPYDPQADVAATRALHPEAQDLRTWLRRKVTAGR